MSAGLYQGLRKSFALALLGGIQACAQAQQPPPMAPPVYELPSGGDPAAQADAGEGPSLLAGSPPDRTRLPTPGPQVVWAPPSPTTTRLSNGIRLWTMAQGNIPLISLLVVIPRGSATDPDGKDGLTYVMADMLDEGAGKLDALQVNEALQRLATAYDVSVHVDHVVVSMGLLADNFEASVELLADILLRPRWSREEFKRRKEQLLAQALTKESLPRVGRQLALRRILFQSGYGSALPSGTGKSLERISFEAAKRHYKDFVVPEGVEIVVTGGVEGVPVQGLLEKALGQWHGKSRLKSKQLSAPPEDLRQIYLVDYPGAAQSVLGLVRRAGTFEDPDYFPEMVFDRSLGGAFTSRINLNLREDKGYTYRAFSTFQRYKKAGIFGIFSDVKTETTRASIDEIVKELKEVCAERPMTAEERAQSVGGLLLGFPGWFESIGQVGGRLASLPMHSRPLDWLQTWPKRVQDVSLEAMQQVAKKYCDPDDFAVIVAGDKASVLPSLPSFGRPIVELDVYGEPVIQSK